MKKKIKRQLQLLSACIAVLLVAACIPCITVVVISPRRTPSVLGASIDAHHGAGVDEGAQGAEAEDGAHQRFRDNGGQKAVQGVEQYRGNQHPGQGAPEEAPPYKAIAKRKERDIHQHGKHTHREHRDKGVYHQSKARHAARANLVGQQKQVKAQGKHRRAHSDPKQIPQD